jgi:hypothetical protein
MSITITLVEGKDYTFEAEGREAEGRAPALTATGLERMPESHARPGAMSQSRLTRSWFRLPAWWG